MLRVEVISSPAAFAALRGEWDALLERSDVSVFQSWEWLHTWWKHFGRGRLWILALRRGEELCGLAPFHISRYMGTPLRRVGFLGTGSSDYLQFIFASELLEEGTTRLLEFVAARRREWDFCDWQQIPADSPLASLPPPAGVESERFVQEVCPYVPLPDTWDAFAASLGKKLRSNIGYHRRLLEREFTIEWITAANGATAPCMESFFRLHQRRWNGRGLPGAFSGNRSRRFHVEVAEALHARGWLRLHVLRLNGEDQAALYCFGHRGRGYYYLGGFEPSLRKYSLGTVLTARAIETAIDEGATEFDFLRGDEPYKYVWKAQDRHNWRWLWWKRGGLSALTPRLNRLERAAEVKIKEWARKRR